MFNKKQLIFTFFVMYLLSVAYANASLRTWSDYTNSIDSSDSLNNDMYVGIRGYSSMMSVNSIQNNLVGKKISKKFYRIYCVGSGSAPNDKWLCGDVLSSEPQGAVAGSESATADIDLSKDQFSTQNMNYKLPAFSVTIGKSILTDGLRVELEAGMSSSSSSSGGLFSGVKEVDISSLKGGVNLAGPPGTPNISNPAPALTGLDKFKVLIDTSFDSELSKSFLGFNLIYDVDIGEIKPFVGVGFAYTMYSTMLNLNGSDGTVNKALFGEAFTDGKTFNTQEYKFSRITYSILAGFSYPVSDTVTAELGYKHTMGGNIDWVLIQKDDKASKKLPIMTIKNVVFKDLFFGVRYNF